MAPAGGVSGARRSQGAPKSAIAAGVADDVWTLAEIVNLSASSRKAIQTDPLLPTIPVHGAKMCGERPLTLLGKPVIVGGRTMRVLSDPRGP
jgi:hypothetical protein